MKKALSKASMNEDESQEVKETMKKGVLNIQPLLVSVVETTLIITKYPLCSNDNCAT